MRLQGSLHVMIQAFWDWYILSLPSLALRACTHDTHSMLFYIPANSNMRSPGVTMQRLP